MLLLASDALAQAKTPEQEKIEALQTEVEKLKGEVERLRAEMASMKEQVAGKSPATSPATTAPQWSPITLGPPDQKLGTYSYSAPAGWTTHPVKDSKLSMMYRSQDRSALILVQVKPKAAAPPEMQAKYGQTIIEMLRRDFAKRNTEVIEQPAVVKDNRFYLKVQEKIKVKAENSTTLKIATQLRLYRVIGPDMIEVTAISMSESPEQVSDTRRAAEEITLGVTESR